MSERISSERISRRPMLAAVALLVAALLSPRCLLPGRRGAARRRTAQSRNRRPPARRAAAAISRCSRQAADGTVEAAACFRAEVFVSAIADARSLRVGDKGTVFIANRNRDKVHAVVELDGRRETRVIASGLDRRTGSRSTRHALHRRSHPGVEGSKASRTSSTIRARRL